MTSYRLPVKEWPESEQPREKLMALGAEQLSNQELLAILLRVGVQGQDVVSLANKLLVDFGGTAGLYRATWQDLAEVRGMGNAKAVSILAALELGRRAMQAEARDRLQVRSP